MRNSRTHISPPPRGSAVAVAMQCNALRHTAGPGPDMDGDDGRRGSSAQLPPLCLVSDRDGPVLHASWAPHARDALGGGGGGGHRGRRSASFFLWRRLQIGAASRLCADLHRRPPSLNRCSTPPGRHARLKRQSQQRGPGPPPPPQRPPATRHRRSTALHPVLTWTLTSATISPPALACLQPHGPPHLR